MTFLALEFPPIGHLVEWEGLFLKGTPFEVNKVVLLMWAGVLIVGGLFLAAGRKSAVGIKSGNLVPAGVQHIAESGIEFVRKDIILQTMGNDGMRYAPFLTTMFFFIFVTNLFEVIPGIQFPVNARMALPIFLAVVVWFIYNIVGIKSQGLGGYLKSVVMPPGVPKGDPPPGGPDRVHLHLHRPALLARRPALRQHARRPPAAGHLLGAVGRAVQQDARSR